MKNLIILIAFAMITCATTANAQSAKPDTMTTNFITKASIGNLQEVAAGKLAAQKAQNTQVKSFGTRMVTDHTTAQNKLLQIIKSSGLKLPPAATGNTVPDDMLVKATGSTFDKMYVHMMVPDHRKTVLLFQTYAINGKDPQLKAFAQQTLPILKQHLASITAIEEQMKKQAAK
ncbi:DUF4142 domain-containing protein [Mucilaginibacter sp. KACC 22063]|uniref:DUF4142 domain-containing protein n=1 Tax=Mucilaginibacter sp. KACC 22063 TaxID=3025666 RepID=UPI002365C411|nr:DUF4142 domain-containing protein [Mucilaginibacter sp. KACC 22063]WDF55672.1 DUF4142 domain-containing protein [Mucilaginibacter sp. KACC 22063]